MKENDKHVLLVIFRPLVYCIKNAKTTQRAAGPFLFGLLLSKVYRTTKHFPLALFFWLTLVQNHKKRSTLAAGAYFCCLDPIKNKKNEHSAAAFLFVIIV